MHPCIAHCIWRRLKSYVIGCQMRRSRKRRMWAAEEAAMIIAHHASNTDSTSSKARADPSYPRAMDELWQAFSHHTPGTTPQMSWSPRQHLAHVSNTGFMGGASLQGFRRLSICPASGIVKSHGPKGIFPVATCRISADA